MHSACGGISASDNTHRSQLPHHQQQVNHNHPPSLFQGQHLHAAFLVVALPLIYIAQPTDGDWLGASVALWYWIAIVTPILHQTFVWVSWRLQLQHQLFTHHGTAEPGFRIYLVLFFTLFVGRFVTLCALCLADQNTLSFPVELRLFLALPILCLAGYTMYSIKRFFGFARAAGIDHFDSEYRNRPLVREGVFRWTSNAMYVFAIQSLWLFGILAASKLALVAAAFQAIYIWVHYYGTEKPDMAFIYRKQQ